MFLESVFVRPINLPHNLLTRVFIQKIYATSGVIEGLLKLSSVLHLRVET